MKVPLPKLAKLIGETVEALEGLQGSILTDGAEVELEVSVLAYCNWLRAGGKVRQSVEVEIRAEQLAKLRAERTIAEAKAGKVGMTMAEAVGQLSREVNLTQACLFLDKKEDTLGKWFAKGCPVERPGGGYAIKLSEVFDWRVHHERTLLQAPEAAGQAGVMHLEAERAMLARSQREAVEMANAVRRKELVDASAVEREWGAIMEIIRGKLLPIGGKVGAMIGGKVGRTVKAMIDDLVHKALTALATGKDADD